MVVSRESSAQPRLSMGRKQRTHPTYNPDANYGRLSGKKMNMKIGELERDPEGYEDINQYLQADAFFSPEPAVKPKPKKNKTPIKKVVSPIVEVENERDFGDDSESDGGSPARYFAAVSPAPPRSASKQRSNLSAQIQRQRRDLSHDYQVDYDSIPAPRSASKTGNTPQRRNASNRATSSTLANGSPRAREKRRADPIPEEDEEEEDRPFDDSNMSLTPPVEPEPFESPTKNNRRKEQVEESPTSVGRSRQTAADRHSDDDDSGPEGFEADFGGDDDGMPPPPEDYPDDDEQEQEPERSASKEISVATRRKRLPSPILEENEDGGQGPEQDQDGEDDREEIPGVLDQQPDEDESEEEEVVVAKPKKQGKENVNLAKRQPLRVKNPNVRSKRNWELEEDNEDEDGIRRSKRRRFEPLQWWRGERLIIRRPKADEAPVPIVADVLRIPKEDDAPLGGKKRGRKASSKPPSSRGAAGKKGVEVYVENPEEGWDEDTEPVAMVLDFESKEQAEKRIAQPAGMVNPQKPPGQEYAFQKIFSDGEFVAGGVLNIPVNGKKPTKGARDNTYIFYCVEGAVRVMVHRTSFIITSNGMFMVPRGNHYYIENICDRECKLFFAQARKVPERLLQSPKKGGSARPSSVIPPVTSTPRSNSKQIDPRLASSVQKSKSKSKAGAR